jgi:hypothetical protein
MCIILIPGISEFCTMLVGYGIVLLLLLLLLHPPQPEYQPYKKRSKWRKWIDRKLAMLTKRANDKAFEAYLYLSTRRRKFEVNRRKGRQRKGSGHHYCTMRRIRALLKIMMVRTAAATHNNNNDNIPVPAPPVPIQEIPQATPATPTVTPLSMPHYLSETYARISIREPVTDDRRRDTGTDGP